MTPPTFYQTISDHQKSKRKVEFCEVTRSDGSKHELTNPTEIAGHIAAVYRKTFNGNFSSDIERLKEFLNEDI